MSRRTPEEPRVVLADNAGLFALGGTKTYLVGRRRVAVVDPGPDDAQHLATLEAAVEGADSGVILVTHGHPDHAAGAPAFSRRTGFPVRRWRGGPDQGGSSGEPLVDGEEISTDGGTLRVIATPGHSRDHVAFLLLERRELLAGDLVLGEGDTTWVGEYPGCVADYMESLDRVAALEVERILPAHGPPLDDPATVLERYRRHRMERMEQVRSALEEGRRLVDEIVTRVYGETLPPRLREAATWSVRAILHHLGVSRFPGNAPREGGGGPG